MGTLIEVDDPPYGSGTAGTGPGSFYGQSADPKSGLEGNLAQLKANDRFMLALIELSLRILYTNGVLTNGVIVTAGTGLSVNIAEHIVNINGVFERAAETVGGLTPSTTLYLWERQNMPETLGGNYSVTPTNVNPGDADNPAIFLAVLTTGAGSVTGVDETNRAVTIPPGRGERRKFFYSGSGGAFDSPDAVGRTGGTATHYRFYPSGGILLGTFPKLSLYTGSDRAGDPDRPDYTTVYGGDGVGYVEAQDGFKAQPPFPDGSQEYYYLDYTPT